MQRQSDARLVPESPPLALSGIEFLRLIFIQRSRERLGKQRIWTGGSPALPHLQRLYLLPELTHLFVVANIDAGKFPSQRFGVFIEPLEIAARGQLQTRFLLIAQTARLFNLREL